MKIAKSISFVVPCALLLAASTASAQDTNEDRDRPVAPQPPRSRLFGTASLGGVVNPVGMQLDAGLQLRAVFSTDERTGWEKSWAQTGGAIRLNPVYVGHAVHGEWQPAQMFSVRAEYELLAFPGTTRGLVSFAEKTAAFGDDVLQNADARAGLMHKVMVAPTFTTKLGPVILRNRSHAAYYHANADGPYFYEPSHDTLVAKDDVVVQGRTELLVLAWSGGRDAAFLLGPVFEMTHAIRTETGRQRLGGMTALAFAETLGAFRRPSLFAEVGGNLQDRNREHQAYATFGFKLEMQ